MKKENTNVRHIMGLRGVHKITLADTKSPGARKAYAAMMKLRDTPDFIPALKAFNESFKRFVCTIENVTPTEGRTIIAKALAGSIATVTEVKITHAAVGTSSTAPATSDTQLGTETARIAITSLTYSGASTYATAFYPAGTGTGTLQEHGLFLNGSATANSGDIISRLLLGGIVKGVSDTLTVESEIQVNDA